MPAANVDIEWIVREVVRRLREMEAESNGRARTSKTPSSKAQPTSGELTIEERLVTLETLHNRLQGINRLVVGPRAIVTPAVVDDLKDRGITLTRGDMPQAASRNGHAPAKNQPGVFLATTGVDRGELQRIVGADVTIDETESNDFASVLQKIAQHVERGMTAVLVTNTPSAAVVAANRNANIRAAVGFNFPAVRRAVDEANANLLAIDPHGKTVAQLAGMIQEFVHRK